MHILDLEIQNVFKGFVGLKASLYTVESLNS